jgi:hypothetical protein
MFNIRLMYRISRKALKLIEQTESVFQKYITMSHIVFLLFWAFYSHTIFTNGANTDLSKLTANQTQLWLQSIAQANSVTTNPRIEIVHLGDGVEIALFDDRDQNRYIFKQNVNKQVDWYLYDNELNPFVAGDIYDRCHGRISSPQARHDLPGIYLYTNNEISYGLGIILVATTNLFQWFNGTTPYSFDDQPSIKNGTQLLLTFETTIYYNINSDLMLYNKKIHEIVEQANVSIENDSKNNLQSFISIKDLDCQRHRQIVFNQIRLLILACTAQVTFKCPLENLGSSCWLEDKRISNIQLNIDSFTFITDRTITVRIDV